MHQPHCRGSSLELQALLLYVLPEYSHYVLLRAICFTPLTNWRSKKIANTIDCQRRNQVDLRNRHTLSSNI
uniref:Uncharacterized protein n=1 Tax=Nelumbo nucifera TaxID=4432 RepID=A0A822ZLT1_NELNU|nr:TPA_asm: hypothetical protein HUJ06_002166 [Nelumbo nucifera]